MSPDLNHVVVARAYKSGVEVQLILMQCRKLHSEVYDLRVEHGQGPESVVIAGSGMCWPSRQDM